MTILKADKVSKQGTMIGTHVGERTFNYLSLYCVAKKTLKSRILTKLFLDWISKQKLVYSEPKLLKMIIDEIKTQRRKKRYRTMSLDEFREITEEELLRKKVPIDYIAKILLEIE